jgi:hypothetical protein
VIVRSCITFAINQYTITYKIDDEVYQTESVDYGSTITPPNAPEREGYTFEWIDVPETMPALRVHFRVRGCLDPPPV